MVQTTHLASFGAVFIAIAFHLFLSHMFVDYKQYML
jgi:hypothetical protein